MIENDVEFDLIDEIELMKTYPINYAKEVLIHLRRIDFLKMHKAPVTEYDTKAMSDVENLGKVVFELLYAHEFDLETFLEVYRPNLKVVYNITEDDDEE